MTPRAAIRRSTASRACRAASGWRSGRSRSGERGIATSSAASAGGQMRRLLAEIGEARGPHAFEIAAERRQGQVDAEDRRPCRAGAPAPAPRRSRRAWPASVRGRRSSRRTACIVRVEAPETTWPCAASWPSARSDGERVDPEMRRETPVLGGDQHAAVERVDLARPWSAAAICRRRKGTRAGSTRRAPAPASTAARCGRARRRRR